MEDIDRIFRADIDRLQGVTHLFSLILEHWQASGGDQDLPRERDD
jgi:hypothetical protein